jgi:lipopolysaccharide transport system ATP-binding protein
MLIKTVSGVELGGAVSASPTRALGFVEAGSRLTVRFHFQCLLTAGTYFLNAGVLAMVDGAETFLHRIIDVAMIRVLAEPDALCTGLVDFHAWPELLAQAPAPKPSSGW